MEIGLEIHRGIIVVMPCWRSITSLGGKKKKYALRSIKDLLFISLLKYLLKAEGNRRK